MGQDRFDDLAVFYTREVILPFPFGHVEFALGIDHADFKRLECGGLVAKKFQPNFIKVAHADLKWNVFGPIIRVALERDKPTSLEFGDQVFARNNRNDAEAAVGKLHTVPLRFFEDRAQTCEQRQFFVFDVKSKADRTWACGLKGFDLGPETAIPTVTLRT